MRIHIEKLRKDRKFQVNYSFSNGVHLKKIRTTEQLVSEIRELGTRYSDFQAENLRLGIYDRHYE